MSRRILSAYHYLCRSVRLPHRVTHDMMSSSLNRGEASPSIQLYRP